MSERCRDVLCAYLERALLDRQSPLLPASQLLMGPDGAVQQDAQGAPLSETRFGADLPFTPLSLLIPCYSAAA